MNGKTSNSLNVILLKTIHSICINIHSLRDHHSLFHRLESTKVNYPLKLLHASKEDFWFEFQGMQCMHYVRRVYGRNSTTLSIFFPFLSHILVVSSYKASNHYLKGKCQLIMSLSAFLYILLAQKTKVIVCIQMQITEDKPNIQNF